MDFNEKELDYHYNKHQLFVDKESWIDEEIDTNRMRMSEIEYINNEIEEKITKLKTEVFFAECHNFIVGEI